MFSINSYAQDKSITESDLIGCWAHSREEDEKDSDVMVYRSCDYNEFPFSRYRHKFELYENGKCSWLSLAANDAHSMIEGAWRYKSKKRVIEIFDSKGKSLHKYRLIEINEKIMKIKKPKVQMKIKNW